MNNKNRHGIRETGSTKRLDPPSPEFARSVESERIAVNPTEDKNRQDRPVTSKEAQFMAIKAKLFSQAGNAAFLRPPGEDDWRVMATVLNGIGQNDAVEAF